MINVADNEKAKETEKASATDDYEDFDNEAMENAEEGLEVEEISISESDVPFDTCQVDRSLPKSESDILEEQDVIVFNEEEKRRILREKYLNAVGRRPKSVPYIYTLPEEKEEKERDLFFGERRPEAVSKQRKERWQNEIKNIRPVGHNYGRVLRDVRLPSLNEGIICVRFEPNGNSLATTYRNGRVEVRNAFTGEMFTKLLTIEQKDSLPVRSARYHPLVSQKIYVGGATGILQVFDLETSTNIGNCQGYDQISNVDLSIDGYNLVTTSRNGQVVIIDPATLEIKSVRQRPNIDDNTQSSIEDQYHKHRIYGLKCHPDDPNVFLTGGWDATVKIWDFRVPGAIKSIRGPWITGEGVDISGDQILTASWRVENSVQIWNYPSGKLIKHIPVVPKTTKFEGEFLYSGKFFRDTFRNNSVRKGLIAVAGNGFYEVSVLDIYAEKVIAFFPSHKAILGLDTLGNMVAYGGKESLFRIGELQLHKSRSRRKL